MKRRFSGALPYHPRDPGKGLGEEADTDDILRTIAMFDTYWQTGRDQGIAAPILIAVALSRILSEAETCCGENGPVLLLENMIERLMTTARERDAAAVRTVRRGKSQ